MKTTAFKVKQRPDGTWEASAPRILSDVSTVADTAERAIAGHTECLEDFEEFKLHVRGKCGPECSRCKDGKLPKGPYRA